MVNQSKINIMENDIEIKKVRERIEHIEDICGEFGVFGGVADIDEIANNLIVDKSFLLLFHLILL